MAKLTTITKKIWQERIAKIIQKKINSNHNLSSRLLKEKIKQYLIKEGYFLEDILAKLENFTFMDDEDILTKEFFKTFNKLKTKYEGEILLEKIKYTLYRKGFELAKIEDLISQIK